MIRPMNCRECAYRSIFYCFILRKHILLSDHCAQWEDRDGQEEGEEEEEEEEL